MNASKRRVIVVGAGGFGREALDVIEAHNRADPSEAFDVLGVADDSPSDLNLGRIVARGYPFLGAVETAFDAFPRASSIVAIGSPSARKAVATALEKRGVGTVSVRHPSAEVGSEFSVGRGAIICSGVQVSTNVKLGEYVHLNPGCVVGHDAVLEDHVSINPAAIVSGEVRVGTGVLVGAGATVLQNLIVAPRSTVGAGAVVTRDVETAVIVVGVPASPIRHPRSGK